MLGMMRVCGWLNGDPSGEQDGGTLASVSAVLEPKACQRFCSAMGSASHWHVSLPGSSARPGQGYWVPLHLHRAGIPYTKSSVLVFLGRAILNGQKSHWSTGKWHIQLLKSVRDGLCPPPPVYQLLLLFLGRGYSVVIFVQLFHSTAVACFRHCAGDVAMPPSASCAPASLHRTMVLLCMSQTIS